jgi:hypothetical protein
MDVIKAIFFIRFISNNRYDLPVEIVNIPIKGINNKSVSSMFFKLIILVELIYLRINLINLSNN